MDLGEPSLSRRLLRLRIFLIAVLGSTLIAAIFGVQWTHRLAGAHSHNRTSPTPLFIESKHLNFGTVWVQPNWRCEIPIENRSHHSVHIDRFRASCSCTSITPASMTIPAGETRTAVVEISLTPHTREKTSKTLRDIAVEMTAETHSEESTETSWLLMGKVKTSVKFSPAQLYLTLDSLTPPSPNRITVHSATDVLIESIETRGLDGLATVTVEQLSESAGTFELTVTPRDKPPSGPFHWQLEILPRTASGEVLPAIPYSVSGEVLQDVIALPQSLVFPYSYSGRALTKSFTVCTRSGRKILNIEVAGREPAGTTLGFHQPTSSAAHLHLTKKVSDQKVSREMLALKVRVEGEPNATIVRVPVISQSLSSE